jgi:hypothetical protein
MAGGLLPNVFGTATRQTLTALGLWIRNQSWEVGQMIRKLILTGIAFLSAVPAFPHNAQFAAGQDRPALHLMNDGEFAVFLKRLDTDVARSQVQLKKMDVKSLSVGLQESDELERSYNRCLQTLDNAREEIQKLSQKQTLKLDLFLLIDLNELARNLDALDQNLMTPAAGGGSGAQKSLGYARQVLGIDATLATDISTFQHHFLAFTGVIDATLNQVEDDPSQPQNQK